MVWLELYIPATGSFWFNPIHFLSISFPVLFEFILQAEYILDLQKQLSLLDGEVRKDSNGTLTDETVTSMAPVDKVCMGSYFTLSCFSLNSIFIIYVNESISLI